MVDPARVSRRDHKQRPRPLLRTMLGDVLRRTRLEQGRTLADVARIARVSMPYLSELERGRKEASSEILAAICDALRIDLSDLLAEVRRELAVDRNRGLSLVRLRSSGDPGVPAAAPSAGGTPGARPDDLDGPALSQPGADESSQPAPAGPQRGTADAQCLLAA